MAFTEVNGSTHLLVNVILWELAPACMLYGFFILIFILCMHSFYMRFTGGIWKFVSLSVLLTLLTALLGIGLTTASFNGLGESEKVTKGLILGQHIVQRLIFLAVGAIFTFRCCMIYQHCRKIFALYGLLVVAIVTPILQALGKISDLADNAAFFVLMIFTNMIFTFLTMRKLMALRKRSIDGADEGLARASSSGMSLFLESGIFNILILCAQLATAILNNKAIPTHRIVLANSSLSFNLPFLSALLPTLLLWRLSLGYDPLYYQLLSSPNPSTSSIKISGPIPSPLGNTMDTLRGPDAAVLAQSRLNERPTTISSLISQPTFDYIKNFTAGNLEKLKPFPVHA